METSVIRMETSVIRMETSVTNENECETDFRFSFYLTRFIFGLCVATELLFRCSCLLIRSFVRDARFP